jgi:hypothetical protein
MIVHSQGLSVLNMQKHFLNSLNFENVKFAINGKCSQNNYDNPNYCASIVIFQTYKNVIVRSVHSSGSFDGDLTPNPFFCNTQTLIVSPRLGCGTLDFDNFDTWV